MNYTNTVPNYEYLIAQARKRIQAAFQAPYIRPVTFNKDVVPAAYSYGGYTYVSFKNEAVKTWFEGFVAQHGFGWMEETSQKSNPVSGRTFYFRIGADVKAVMKYIEEFSTTEFASPASVIVADLELLLMRRSR